MRLECQVCGGRRLFEFLDLGHHPPSDEFLDSEDLKGEEATYPLRLYFCEECKLVQIGYKIDPIKIFGTKYIYLSGQNESLGKHLQSIPKYLVKEFNLSKKDLAIDIGANDGTLLESYQPYGIGTLGIEPTAASGVMERKGISVVKEFFNEQVANDVLQRFGKAKVITATNVFAHVRDLDSLMKGVKRLLSDDGVFLTESHYLMDMVEGLQYVEVYLEHLRYYSLASLTYLFGLYDMEIFHAERVLTHGGSIRTLACRAGAYPKTSLSSLVEKERLAKLNTKEVMVEFAQRVRRNRVELMKLLWRLNSEGKRIAAIAAPAKGNTLLNYCRIGTELVDYAVDSNPLKIGKWTPGTHLKIVDEAALLADQPDYTLLLSWDIRDVLIPKLRKKGYQGRFILPIPRPSVL